MLNPHTHTHTHTHKGTHTCLIRSGVTRSFASRNNCCWREGRVIHTHGNTNTHSHQHIHQHTHKRTSAYTYRPLSPSWSKQTFCFPERCGTFSWEFPPGDLGSECYSLNPPNTHTRTHTHTHTRARAHTHTHTHTHMTQARTRTHTIHLSKISIHPFFLPPVL